MATTDTMRLPSADHEGEAKERFNYRGIHRYYITLPVHGDPAEFNTPGLIFSILNVLREQALAQQFDVYAYCFLPDRLVLIVRGKDETSDMKAFLSAFRTSSTEATAHQRRGRLWSKRYMERVLRKSEESRSIAKEVFMLPVKAGLVPSPLAYERQGSFVISLAVLFGKPHTADGRGQYGHEHKGGRNRPNSSRPGGNRPDSRRQGSGWSKGGRPGGKRPGKR